MQRPKITHASRPLTFEVEALNEKGEALPTPIAGEEYSGYPLVASGSPALAWFFGGLPLLIVLAWWWSRRPPRIAAQFIKDGGQP